MNFADVFEFTIDLDHLRRQYKVLSQKYHPDKGGNVENFKDLKSAYEQAINAISNKDIWVGSSFVYLELNNKILKFKFRYSQKRDEGYIFSNQKYILNILNSSYRDLSSIAHDNLIHIYRKEFEKSPVIGLKKSAKLLPQIDKSHSSLTDGIITFLKPKNVYPLSLLLEKYQNDHGAFDIPHATWMTGRLLNLFCFLEVSGVVHGDISIDNLWVDPDSHELYLFGGWQFSRKLGEKFISLPSRSANFLKENIATNQLTSELIRDTMLKLYHPNKNEIRFKKILPGQIVEFLSLPFSKGAIDTYKTWEKLRDGTWERKFVKFEYNPEKLT
jgi:hypothetical protein